MAWRAYGDVIGGRGVKAREHARRETRKSMRDVEERERRESVREVRDAEERERRESVREVEEA